MVGAKTDIESAERRAFAARFAALAALTGLAVLTLTSPVQAVSLQWHTQMSDADFHAAGGPYDLLPSAMAAGRYNRDGMSDLVFCSAAENACGLYYGAPGVGGNQLLGDPDILFVGPGGGFGAAAAFLGDLNGDGLEDLGIGGPGAVGEGGVLGGGSLWIFFGRSDGFTGAIGYYDANTTVFGAENLSGLGTAAAPAGDVDRDGYGDFWVTAPNATEAGTRVGEVLLYRGRDVWPTELYRSGAALRLVGTVFNGTFGRVLLGNNDLNGDGRFDLATASQRYRDASNTTVGAAFAFMGPFPTDGRTMNATGADLTIWGDANAPSLGSSLAFAVNFTKEGGRILMVGAPAYSNNTSTGGSLHLFKIIQAACCLNWHRWDAVGLLYTSEPNDQMGLSAAAGGDINHDGFPDLIIGAPSAEVGVKHDAGRVFIVYGNDTSRQPVLLTDRQEGFEGRGNNTVLGNLLLLTDFNGDGWSDLVLSSPGDGFSSPAGGAAYGFVGRPRNRPPSLDLAAHGNFTEGSIIQLLANLTDPDGDRLSWDWQSLPDGRPHSGAATVDANFSDEGNYTVTVSVFDGTLYNTTRILLQVQNLPPVCNITWYAPFVEGEAGQLSLEAHDPGRLDMWTYNWSGPVGLFVGSLSAVYEPQRAAPFQVNVTITDNDGGVGHCGVLVPVSNIPPEVAIQGPLVLYEGDVGIYTAAIQDPGAEDAFFMNWSTPLGLKNDSHYVYRAMHPGPAKIELLVTDLDGGETYASLDVNVRGIPPDVGLIMPNGATEGDALTFEIRQYTGEAFDPITVSWRICLFGKGEGNVYTVVKAESGEYCVQVIVFDDDFEAVTFNATIVVVNRGPLDGMRVRPDPGGNGTYQEGQTITLDAVVGAWETTPTAFIHYNWTIDGERISTARSTSFLAEAGRHQVSVEGIDKEGAVSVISRVIVVINNPPSARMNGPSLLVPGAVGEWTATATDVGGGDVRLSWDVDGVQMADGPSFRWSTSVVGAHVVRVTATDSAGATSVQMITVSVSPPPPTSAGIDLRWVAVPLGAAAAFAAGIMMGAWVIGKVRSRKPEE